MSMEVEDDPSAPQVMMNFYRRLYPFKSIFNWLNHQPTPSRLFTHREFALTLPGDVYIRYNSFANVDEFKKHIVRMNPSRFEIGAVYTARPRDRKTLRAGALQPLQRELVFDIDMTDYDEIRTCCAGKGICKRCWGFIAVAVKILDNALREQFGFRRLLWVYSGRRGIHCWVSDDEALQLTDDQRRAIMGWIDVIKGGKDMAKKVNKIRGLMRGHGIVVRPTPARSALQIARGAFPALVLQDQDCFSGSTQTDVLLELLGDTEVSGRLRRKWAETNGNSEDKWADVRYELKNKLKVNDLPENKENTIPLYRALEDIVLQYTYPRIDSEVTKHRNHLLKAPFCVHPATGRVCVPIDPRRIDEFDPESVPTVGQLLRELNELKTEPVAGDGMDVDRQESDHHSDWERTSLKPYVDLLDSHVRSLMEDVRRKKREQGDISQDF